MIVVDLGRQEQAQAVCFSTRIVLQKVSTFPMSVVAFATTTSTCGRNVSNYGPSMKTRCLKLWPKFENKMLRLVAQLWKKKVGPLVLQETRGGTSQPIEGAQNKILEMMVSQNWTSLIMNGGYYHLMKWWFPKPKLHKQWMVGWFHLSSGQLQWSLVQWGEGLKHKGKV